MNPINTGVVWCFSTDADISAVVVERRRHRGVSQVRADVPGQELAFGQRRLVERAASLLDADRYAHSGRRLATTAVL